MKALDTPVLLSLLEGDPRLRRHLRRWRGEEVATTEANLLELTHIAAGGPARSRAERLSAIGRLRQRLTVLPIGAAGVEEMRRRAPKGALPASPLVSGMLTALETSGCEELLTDDPRQIPGKWRFRVTKLSESKA